MCPEPGSSGGHEASRVRERRPREGIPGKFAAPQDGYYVTEAGWGRNLKYFKRRPLAKCQALSRSHGIIQPFKEDS